MTGETENKELQSADILEILKLLPHRYPFLMVDKIIDIDGDISGIGVKNVTINEPHFQGHFPDNPVMPGVLLIEAMAQTAGVLVIKDRQKGAEPADGPSTVYFMMIDKGRFRQPVVPGDTVYFHVTQLKKRSNIWKYKGEAKVDGKTVAEAEISAMIPD